LGLISIISHNWLRPYRMNGCRRRSAPAGRSPPRPAAPYPTTAPPVVSNAVSARLARDGCAAANGAGSGRRRVHRAGIARDAENAIEIPCVLCLGKSKPHHSLRNQGPLWDFTSGTNLQLDHFGLRDIGSGACRSAQELSGEAFPGFGSHQRA
jgi:hypothetical protein